MSGHSKWATTKHKKALIDSKRSSLFTKLTKNIQIAARDGADPSMNFKLRMAIDKAKSYSVPKDNIEKAISRGSGTGEGTALEEMIYEGYGPNGVAIIIEVVTDNKNRAASDIRHILSKHGGALGASNSVLWQFDRVGVIYLKNTGVTDEQELAIIDAGANDIEVSDDGVRVITNMTDLQKVQEAIKNIVEIDNAELEYIAKNKVKLEDTESLDKLFDALDENEDAGNYYSNIE